MSGSIGRRYARADELGYNYCVTYDFDSVEKGLVTIRDRESTKQIRVPVGAVGATLRGLLAGKDFLASGDPI